jgi:predicted permease
MIRHIMAEPLLLTVAGAAGGFLLAFAAAPLSVRWLPPIRDFTNRQLPLTIDLQPDLRVLTVSVVVALATALLFGLGPAFALARTDVQSVLRRGSASARSSRRQVLVMVQIASCTILLGATALLLRTFEQLVRTRPSFDPDRVVSFTIDPSLAVYTPEQEQALLRQLTARVQTLPGVTAVGYASCGIMRGRGLGATVAPAGQNARDDFLNVSLNSVSPAYFQTLGVALLAGRTITDADGRSAKPQRVVVNEAFAKRFFPNVAPVGQRFGVSRGGGVVQPEYEIVGVVSDAKYRSLREPITPTFYTSFSDSSFVLDVRMAKTPESISAPVRRIVADLDSSLPVIEVETLSEEVQASTAGERLAAARTECFGALGAILAAVGLYALLAYFVAQKRREIGIRMALGATRTDVGLLIGRESFRLRPASRSL